MEYVFEEDSFLSNSPERFGAKRLRGIDPPKMTQSDDTVAVRSTGSSFAAMAMVVFSMCVSANDLDGPSELESPALAPRITHVQGAAARGGDDAIQAPAVERRKPLLTLVAHPLSVERECARLRAALTRWESTYGITTAGMRAAVHAGEQPVTQDVCRWLADAEELNFLGGDAATPT